jgi:serine protease Do
MLEEKERATASENTGASRHKLRKYLLSGVAAVALIGAAPAIYTANADVPVLRKNEAPGTLTPGQNVIGLPDFTQLVKRVKPAVVSVRVKEMVSAQAMSGDNSEESPFKGNPFENDPFKGTPFEKFFHDRGGSPFASPHPVEAQGSGFFISADGYLVTNNHVVDDASEVQVVTDGGQTYTAKVVGTDKQTDLALVKVDADKQFPFVTLSKEKPEIGQWVVAMGNPFGLGGTVTAGIVSAEGRDIGEGPYDNFLQIDAPINRGNSGGPTFNLKGEVVGVNTAIFSPSGGSVGIAFDIPAATVENVVSELQKHGHVTRGWLGVQIQPVTQDIADSLGLKSDEGALITKPQADSPAAQAGLRSGEVITAVDGENVKDARALAQKIAAISPGTETKLTVVRGGKPETVTVKIGRMETRTAKHAPADRHGSSQVGKLGLELAPADEVEGAGGKGVAVVSVEPGGEAASLGMAPGDVILKAGGKSVSTPPEVKDALEEARVAGRKHTLVLLRHGKSEIYIAVPVSAG